MIARLLAAVCALMSASAGMAQDYRARLPEDEIVYFLLPDRFENGDPSNDRGGLTGDRLRTGFDPTDKGFYHGGDLKGLISRLDYIQALGATAIWVGPIFRNQPVQGAPGHESAGYHGYWITDFTRVDPHLGTNADFRALVAAAHGRGMKVYMDIIVNHTADVIRYRECPTDLCPYRTRADYPYQRHGGTGGAPINPGFAGDTVRTAANFEKLTDPRFAYTPYVPTAQQEVKVPGWLNNPLFYHNRGNTTYTGESSTMGDFANLDDLMTENPFVVKGMIDIYGGWVDRYGVDGFRIDTAKHVNPEFWQAFVPAMLARAKARGIPHFHIFGEAFTDVVDPASIAEHTRVDGLPSMLDFAFMAAVIRTVAEQAGTTVFDTLFQADSLYEGGAGAALRLPTFLGNHDAGRFAMAARRGHPQASDDEVLKRVMLANAMLLTLRGVPTIYSGDEQGFVGHGGDQDSRQDMFASHVASYNDMALLGSTRTTAVANFDESHPLFREIATLAHLRAATPALRRGRQIVRARGEAPGLFAVSRFDPGTGQEFLIAFNTSTTPVEANVEVETRSHEFVTLSGQCPVKAAAPGSVRLMLAPLSFAICGAGSSR